MMEVDSTSLPGPGVAVDADDLITFDDNDGIEWVQDSTGNSTDLPNSAKPNRTEVDASKTNADQTATDVGTSGDIHDDGGPGADGSDVKMLSDALSVLEEEIHILEEGEDIDWHANGEDTIESGRLGSFEQESLVQQASAVSTSGDIVQLDEEILYDEEDYELDPAEVNPSAESIDATSLGPDVKDKTIADGEASHQAQSTMHDAEKGVDLVPGVPPKDIVEIVYDEEEDFDQEDADGEDYADGGSEEYYNEKEERNAGEEHPDDASEVVDSEYHPDHEGENDLAGNSGDNPIFVEEVTIVQDDGEEEDENASESSSEEIPAVTVCYKGGEFPCFRGDHSSSDRMPFFSSTAALESTMDLLLASFRQELSDELSPCDEIVFQVEELGLEYCESTPRDTLIGVTLKQILEIFNLLVKNQDPDANPRLYTNLFTRPSTTKRLESLIEDAFAGKGLSEVSYKFRQHADHESLGIEETGQRGGNQDRFVEEYESYQESQEGQDAEEAEYDTMNNNEVDIEDDGGASNQPGPEHLRSLANDYSNLGAMFDEPSTHIGVESGDTQPVHTSITPAHDQGDEEYEEDDGVEHELDATSALDGIADPPPSPCYRPDFCFCGGCVATSVVEIRRECAESHRIDPPLVGASRDSHRHGLQLYASRSSCVTFRSGTASPEHNILGSSTIQNLKPYANNNYQAYTNDKVYDEDIEDEDDDLHHQDDYHDDGLADELDLTHNDAIADELGKETNTSGTATLDGEDDIDFGADAATVPENGPLTIELDGEEEEEEEEENEINWNDNAEPVEHSTNPKRPREEEASAEGQGEQHDPKRRRS